MAFFDLTFKFHAPWVLGNHSFDFVPVLIVIAMKQSNGYSQIGLVNISAGVSFAGYGNSNIADGMVICSIASHTLSWWGYDVVVQMNLSGNTYQYTAFG